MGSSKPKRHIFFIISDDLYVRNYIRTGVIDYLNRSMRVSILADSRISLSEEVSARPDFRGFFTMDARAEALHSLLAQILMWRNRDKSRTFLLRWMRLANWGLIKSNRGRVVLILSALRWSIGLLGNWAAIRIPLFGNRIAFPIVSRVLKRQILENRQLRNVLELELPNLVIFPSAAYEASGTDVATICKSLNIPSLALIDNWDNLSSKTVYWSKPDNLAVWGPQTRDQAISIHGFKKEQVHNLGTPRFESYFSMRNAKPVAPYDFPYILFVGSAMPFDELGALHAIEDYLRTQIDANDQLKIVYRPHPWQHKRSSFNVFRETDYSFTILDTQLSNSVANVPRMDRDRMRFQPALDYYPGLLANAQIVVGPLTTMLFEAALCLRPVVALAYSDGHHFNTSRRYFSHFDGLERVPGFYFCESRNSLQSVLKKASNHVEIGPAESDQITSRYLFRSNQGYNRSLENLISSIIE